MKKKLLLLSAMAVMACSENVTAQKTVSNIGPRGLQKAVQLRPDVKNLIRQQIQKQNNTAQKTTAPELLIASYGYYNNGGGVPDHDSTTYSYSGSRGSNLTDIFSYFDYFYPIGSVSPGQNYAPTLLFDTSFYFDGNSVASMTKQSMTNRTYDAANNIVLQHDRSYNSSGVLDDHSYFTSSYDANNNIINATEHRDTSAAIIGMFEMTGNIEAKYASGTSRRLSDTIENYWLSFVNRMFTEYTYNGSGLMTKSLTKTYDGFSGTWENNYQNTYTYDASNRIVTAVRENWNTMSFAWEVDNKDSMGYAGSAPIYSFYQSTSYSNGIPSNSYRQYFILNSFQSVDSIYSFEEDNGNWVPDTRGKLTYNSNQHLAHYEETEYDDMVGTWNTTPSSILRWHYAAATNVKDAQYVPKNFVQLYPNPSVQNLNLKIENPQGRIAINIYNLTGQLLQTFSQTASELVQINLTSLPAGSYMAEVIMNGNVQHSKFVKQ